MNNSGNGNGNNPNPGNWPGNVESRAGRRRRQKREANRRRKQIRRQENQIEFEVLPGRAPEIDTKRFSQKDIDILSQKNFQQVIQEDIKKSLENNNTQVRKEDCERVSKIFNERK